MITFLGMLCGIPVAWAQGTQPLVAIHDSELTRALESMPATAPTPTGSDGTGYQWWTSDWPHYFVMPEALQEALRSDGTAFTTVRDTDISAGLLLPNGQPKYPILISLASEAVRNDEIAPLTNYVAAGGFLFVGSSAFTRNPDGSSRGDFAFANQLGLHMVVAALTNWGNSTYFTKTNQPAHRLVSHIPDGPRTWRMPRSAEEITYGVSPAHTAFGPHDVWQVQAADATVLAMGDAYPYLLVKPYGKGCFIYYAPLQPLIGHGGYAPSMYAYVIFRRAIEWAFESARLPVPKLSPWPYAYDAAFTLRYDLENYTNLINHIEQSAQIDFTNGVKADYYFCTGTLREDAARGGYDTNAMIASLRRAVQNYGATIGPHNGGLKNPRNAALTRKDYDYWHWGPDEALDLTPTNYPSGKAYALSSLSNAFVDIETWLAGTGNGNGLRHSMAPYFNATREDSYDLQVQLGSKLAGEQKLSPFPHWTVSTRTSGKRYSLLSEPLSDWYARGSQIPHSLEWLAADVGGVANASLALHNAIDFYYNLGGLLSFYGDTLATGEAPAGSSAGSLPLECMRYSLNTNLHSRLWSANAVGVYQWWLQRSNAQVRVSYATSNVNLALTTLSVSGATDPQTAVELLLPSGSCFELKVATNGVVAGADSYRTNGQVLKLRVGTTVTNAVVSYRLGPQAQSDFYATVVGVPLTVAAPGVLSNDAAGLGGSNLSAVLISGPANGSLNLNADGHFTYSPTAGFSGMDSFCYQANDGVSNSSVATVVLSVTPAGVLFFDNFTRSTNAASLAPWQPVLGTWAITNGVLQGSSAPHTYGYACFSNNWTDYSVQAGFQFPTGALGAGLGGRLNPLNGAHYAAWLYPEGSLGPSATLRLIKFFDWTNWTALAQMNLPALGATAHTLRLSFQGSQLWAHFDGNQVTNITDGDVGGVPAYPRGGVSVDLATGSSRFVLSVDDLTVMPLAAGPLANNDTYTVNAYHSLTVPAPGVLGNDSGGVGNLTAALVSGPLFGTLSLSSNGGFSYIPTSTFIGTDTFTYQVRVGQTNSAAAVVSLQILASPPVASNYNYTLMGPETLTVGAPGLLANPTGVAISGLTPLVVSGPAHGVLTLGNNGGFSYTPTNQFAGLDFFTYQISDGRTLSPVATVALLVEPAEGLFVDDFTRLTTPQSLSPWLVAAGNWTLTGGVLQGGPNPTNSSGYAYLTSNWTNYAVQARIRFASSNAWGGGLGGCLNPVSGAHYAAWIYPDRSPGGSNVLKLVKWQSWDKWSYRGVTGAFIQQVNLPSVGTNWHTLKLAFTSSTIKVYYDNLQVINATDAEAQPLLGGGISLDQWTELTPYAMSVDEVQVTRVPPEIPRPRITSITRQTDRSMRVGGTGIANQTYLLQQTVDFRTWTAVSTNTADATGGLQFVDGAAPNSACRFYRISTQ